MKTITAIVLSFVLATVTVQGQDKQPPPPDLAACELWISGIVLVIVAAGAVVAVRAMFRNGHYRDGDIITVVLNESCDDRRTWHPVTTNTLQYSTNAPLITLFERWTTNPACFYRLKCMEVRQ
jgi:hypothetical protein